MYQVENRVFHGDLLEGERLGKHPVADKGVEATGFHQIDRHRQQVTEVRLQTTQIEKITARVEVYKEVDIAGRIVFTPGNRSEDPDIRSAMQASESQNCGTLVGLEMLEGHFTLSSLCTRQGHWGQNDDITVVTIRRNA